MVLYIVHRSVIWQTNEPLVTKTRSRGSKPIVGVEYEGGEELEPPQTFFKGGGSTPAGILLNLIAVTILANPVTLDVAKKTTFIHSKFILFINDFRFAFIGNLRICWKSNSGAPNFPLGAAVTISKSPPPRQIRL